MGDNSRIALRCYSEHPDDIVRRLVRKSGAEDAETILDMLGLT